MSRLRMTIVISLVVIVVVAAVGAVVAMEPLAPPTGPLAVTPFGTGFTYQGRLDQSGEPAFGGFDFTFSLYDTEVDGLQIGEAIEFHDVAVVDGLFTVQLDFGREALNGDGRWLAIGVKPMEQDGPFTLLSPRQPLTPAPYAIYASNAWSLTGNTGTNPGSNILGTTDEQPLVLGTNGVEALRIDVEGNVGIGIANPQSALEIANASEMLRIDGTGGSYLRIRKGTDNTSNGLIETIKEGSFRSALYLNANEPNDVIIAQGGGNVGIGFHPHVGPEAPQAKLHVKPHSDNDVEVVRFESNDGELVVVDKDGNMGIGTSEPLEHLTVNGDSGVEGIAFADGMLANDIAVIFDLFVGDSVTALGIVDAFDGKVRLWQNTADAGLVVLESPTGNRTVGLNTLNQTNGENGYVSVWANGSQKVALYASAAPANSGVFALLDGSDDVRIFLDGSTGSIFGTTKSFTMDHPNDSSKSIVYTSIEGPEAAAYTRGTTQLIDGKAEVTFDEHFSLVINPDTMTVQVTPLSANSLGLAVVEKSNQGFTIRELGGGAGSYNVDYLVQGVRKGFEDYEAVRDKNAPSSQAFLLVEELAESDVRSHSCIAGPLATSKRLNGLDPTLVARLSNRCGNGR